MDRKAGAQISWFSYNQSFMILFALMTAAGFLTTIVSSEPNKPQSVAARQVLLSGSFQAFEGILQAGGYL